MDTLESCSLDDLKQIIALLLRRLDLSNGLTGFLPVARFLAPRVVEQLFANGSDSQLPSIEPQHHLSTLLACRVVLIVVPRFSEMEDAEVSDR
jgi:hypothetical protein